MNKLGQEIRKRREALGFTQKKLAGVARLHRGEITKIEYARCNPGVLTLDPIARALGMRLSELIAAAER